MRGPEAAAQRLIGDVPQWRLAARRLWGGGVGGGALES